MHALDARRIDEDFIERPRQWHFGELAALELDGNLRLDVAGVVDLIEIGTDRRLNRIDEQPQDAVLVEAVDLFQLFLDARGDVLLAYVTDFRRGLARIEARVEQRDDIGGNGCVLHQRRPHVVLRIGHADLPQIAGQSADQRHIAPSKTAQQCQRVVAVILGAAAHDHQEGGLQPRLAVVEFDGAAVMALQQHVVEPDARRVGRLDLIGPLVDDAEAHVFQHRDALRQRQRPGVAPHF